MGKCYMGSSLRNDIASLTNIHKYGLWVGNCCSSNKFDEPECFGEAALRASNKGAVGYIGATELTFFDQDFYWSVGFKTFSANPSYDPNHLGAYDRLFHINGESSNDWYTTQGQYIVAGNLAVQESGTWQTWKLYYWETYHLMGDPSLKILTSCSETNISGIISSNTSYSNCRINIKNTTIQNNSNVIIDAVDTIIDGLFEVKIGSSFEIK